MSMWRIYEKKLVSKQLSRLPKSVLQHYELWKRIVELEGLAGLKLIKGFHDEALKGKRRGFRSSRLSQKWRVIYKVEKTSFKIYIFEINPHDY